MSHYYLDEQSKTAIERKVGRTGLEFIETAERNASRLPELARATESVEQYTLHDFQLLANTPNSLQDGSDTRSAYALCTLAADDVVEIKRYRGEDSGGFLGALKCGDSSSSCECLERLFALIEKHVDLTSNLSSEFESGVTMQQKIDEGVAACGCSSTSICGGCEMPEPVTLTFSGFQNKVGRVNSSGLAPYCDFGDLNGKSFTMSNRAEPDDPNIDAMCKWKASSYGGKALFDTGLQTASGTRVTFDTAYGTPWDDEPFASRVSGNRAGWSYAFQPTGEPDPTFSGQVVLRIYDGRDSQLNEFADTFTHEFAQWLHAKSCQGFLGDVFEGVDITFAPNGSGESLRATGTITVGAA